MIYAVLKHANFFFALWRRDIFYQSRIFQGNWSLRICKILSIKLLLLNFRENYATNLTLDFLAQYLILGIKLQLVD